MSNEIVRGNSVRSSVTFLDVDGDLLDPTAVVCMVKYPDGTETTYTYGTDAITRESQGVYHFWIATATAGTYTPRWKGSDATTTIANEASFEVEESVFTTP